MARQHFDLVVIGSGPAGQNAAVTAAKLGKRVAVADKPDMLGGVCLRTGGIPSKALREAVLYLTGFRQRSFYGPRYAVKHQLRKEDLMFRVQQVVEREVRTVRQSFARHGVEMLPGLARFVDPHTLEIATDDGAIQVTSDFVLIACGTRPAQHPQIPVDEVRVFDTDGIVHLSDGEVPETGIVVGAGVIGLEYASMAGPLGMQVTVVDERAELLPFVDHELVAALVSYLESQGTTFRLREKVSSVSVAADGLVVVCLESGDRLSAQRLLYAAPRQANADRLHLEAAGLRTDEHGRLAVNEVFQTAAAHIYAAGDVVGFPALASTAIEQGQVASCHMFGRQRRYDIHLLPLAIYTIPELSMVGKTEQQLRREGVAYEVGTARFAELAKGQLVGEESGRLKLLFDPDSKALLGVHVIGETAAEILHIGHLAMLAGFTVEYLRDSVFNFPTMAEAYQVAAADGLSKL